MATREPVGNIVLVARGDQDIFGKKLKRQCDDNLGWEPDASIGAVRISDMDSTLSYADITERIEDHI